jgi:hypothetical protein
MVRSDAEGGASRTMSCTCGHPSRLAEDGEHLRVNAIAFIPGMTAAN